jgi:hypothetical protein
MHQVYSSNLLYSNLSSAKHTRSLLHWTTHHKSHHLEILIKKNLQAINAKSKSSSIGKIEISGSADITPSTPPKLASFDSISPKVFETYFKLANDKPYR